MDFMVGGKVRTTGRPGSSETTVGVVLEVHKDAVLVAPDDGGEPFLWLKRRTKRTGLRGV